MSNVAYTIAMLAAFLLIGGGFLLIFKHKQRQRGVLMLIAALVIAANVAIWTWPAG